MTHSTARPLAIHGILEAPISRHLTARSSRMTRQRHAAQPHKDRFDLPVHAKRDASETSPLMVRTRTQQHRYCSMNMDAPPIPCTRQHDITPFTSGSHHRQILTTMHLVVVDFAAACTCVAVQVSGEAGSPLHPTTPATPPDSPSASALVHSDDVDWAATGLCFLFPAVRPDVDTCSLCVPLHHALEKHIIRPCGACGTYASDACCGQVHAAAAAARDGV